MDLDLIALDLKDGDVLAVRGDRGMPITKDVSNALCAALQRLQQTQGVRVAVVLLPPGGDATVLREEALARLVVENERLARRLAGVQNLVKQFTQDDVGWVELQGGPLDGRRVRVPLELREIVSREPDAGANGAVYRDSGEHDADVRWFRHVGDATR